MVKNSKNQKVHTFLFGKYYSNSVLTLLYENKVVRSTVMQMSQINAKNGKKLQTC